MEITDPNSDPFLMRFLGETIEKFGLDYINGGVDKKKERAFIDRAIKEGLITKPRKMSLIEYISTMPPLRDLFRR